MVLSPLGTVNPVGKVAFALTTPHARITGQAAIALSQHGTVAPSIIHHRTEFASSMIDDRTVM